MRHDEFHGMGRLFEDGLMDVSFTCLDPIAYGRETPSSEATFEVGGTAPTWPVIEVTALGSAPIEIMDGNGLFISIA